MKNECGKKKKSGKKDKRLEPIFLLDTQNFGRFVEEIFSRGTQLNLEE